jgi:hypothetical protein
MTLSTFDLTRSTVCQHAQLTDSSLFVKDASIAKPRLVAEAGLSSRMGEGTITSDRGDRHHRHRNHRRHPYGAGDPWLR